MYRMGITDKALTINIFFDNLDRLFINTRDKITTNGTRKPSYLLNP